MLGISLIITKLKNLIITEIQDYHNLKDNENNLIIDINKYKSIKELFGIDFVIISPDENNQYLHNISGYDEEKSKYISYIGLNFDNLTIDSLLHELKHAYVDWCIYKNGGIKINESKEVKELYTVGFEQLLTSDKNKIPNLITILENFYYSTKLEIPSFLENHFFDESYVNYKTKIMNMINFNRQKYSNEICEKEFELLRSYEIPRINKFKTYDKFLKYCEKFFKIRGEYILRKINKVDYLNKVKDSDWVVHLIRGHIHNKKTLSLLEWDFIINSLDGVITNRGQWDFPGKCTMIPTETFGITMKDVKYDVLGIDGNGKYILMKPEIMYYFSTNYVFEIPDMGEYSKLIKKILKKS